MEDHVEMGNFTGFAAPVLGSLILQRTGGDWNPLIYLFGAACVVWGIVALRMFEEQRDSASAAGGTFFYLTGRGHFAAGLALLSEVVRRLAATLKARMITSFVLLIHIPGLCAAPRNRLQMDNVLYGVGAGRSVVGGRITPGFLLDLGPAVAPQRGVFEDCEFPLNSMNGHMKPSQVDIAGGYIQCHHKSGQCHWVNRS